MKNKIKLILAASLLSVGVASAQTGGVGVGTTTPDASSALDVTSTTKGFLMPRMTTTERTAIATPATGLQVYDITTNSQWYYNGTVWVNAATAGQKWVDGATAGDIELVNPTGDNKVMYTDAGYKFIDKDLLTANLWKTYDESTNAYIDQPLGLSFENNYNLSLNRTSNIIKSNPANVWSGLSTIIGRIDGADSRVNETTLGLSSIIQIYPDNAKNHNNVRGLVGNVVGSGTGTVTNLIGVHGGVTVNKDQGASNAICFRGFSLLNSSKNVNFFAGYVSQLQVGKNQTGTINKFAGFSSTNSFFSSSVTNVTSLMAYDVSNGSTLSSSWTGTITNYYDFYAPAFTNGGGTVTNKYGLYVGGTDKINFFEGNMGIGTASPTQKLSINVTGDGAKVLGLNIERPWEYIQSGSGATSQLHLRPTTSDKIFKIVSPSGVVNSEYNVSDTAASNRVNFVTTGGRVGIGTSAPSTSLQVIGATTTDGIVNNAYLTQKGEIYLNTSGNNGGGIISTTGESDSTNGLAITSSRGGGKIVFNTNPGTITERMRILVNGNVGIGTTTPTEKLEVNGAIKIGETSAATPTAGTIRFNTTTSKFEGYDGTAWVAFH